MASANASSRDCASVIGSPVVSLAALHVAGALYAIRVTTAHHGTTSVHGTSVHRIVVSVSDLERSLAVYEHALGLSRLWSNDEVARLSAGDVELMLHQRIPVPSELGVAATFAVDDVDAVTAAAVAAGSQIVHGPNDEPWGERQTVLHDPDGHVFCLVTPIRTA